MRGDSLRDLYAKILAVLGLGLLGAAGALVDYWPVRADLPFVVENLALPDIIHPLDVARELPTAAVALDRRQPTVVTAAMPDSDLAAGRLTADDRDIGAPVDAMLAVSAPDPVVETTAMIPAALAVGDGVALPPVATTADLVDPLAGPATSTPGEGVWAGVSKKTAHGVGKAGTAIADGFVKVGSAVGSAFGHLRSIF